MSKTLQVERSRQPSLHKLRQAAGKKESGLRSKFFSLEKLVYPWNSPIPLIFVEGDSTEMGKQFAKATKSIAKRNVAYNLPSLERIFEKSKVRKKDYLSGLEVAVREHSMSEYLNEMQAIADTVDLPYESILLLNANVDIMATLPFPESTERFFCSMFAAWGKSTTESSVIAGHNDDGGRIMDQYSVLKIAKPKRGYPFVCPQVPGYVGYDCLVNANGLFCCGAAVDDKMKNSEAIYDGVPNWMMYRWLGQYSSNTEDAIKRLFSVKNMTFKNWCFISKDQGGKVVEATPKHHAFMKYPSRTKDWVAVSTCLVCPELSQYVVRSKEPTSGDYRRASVEREVSKRYGDIDSDSAIEILSSHYDSKRKRIVASEHTPCRHMEYEDRFAGTCRCIIANFGSHMNNGTASTRIDVCLGNPCNGYWRSLKFDGKFDLVSGYNKNDDIERELGKLIAAM